MPKVTMSRPLPANVTWRSARISDVKKQVSQVTVEVTFWSQSGVPTFRTYKLVSRSRNRHWELLEQVCLSLKEMGFAAADVTGYTFGAYTSPIHQVLEGSEPESLLDWLAA